jgi:dienelactone hydrolase
MAGNVREWCLNESRNQRYILGGGWNDQTYMFNDAYTQDSFNRFETNGFRCMKFLDPEKNLANLSRPIDLPFRDFLREKPVSDQTFKFYLSLFRYDRTNLHATIETSDTTEAWIKQRITFDAAYGNERMMAYLFLPRRAPPPYQTVIFFPGGNALHTRSSKEIGDPRSDFIISSGRALIWPIYKGTYERGTKLTSDYPNETNLYKEHLIMWAKDLSRSIDYLETRKDIDSKKIAYYGVSWGAMNGPIMTSVEPRMKVVILNVAGLAFQKAQSEVDAINYVSRVKAPVLMLNGRYDHFFPVESSQIPLFRLLGTSPEHKRQIIYAAGHIVPRNQLIKESLDWLDKYLGPVK